jgi:hypothetical protein
LILQDFLPALIAFRSRSVAGIRWRSCGVIADLEQPPDGPDRALLDRQEEP